MTGMTKPSKLLRATSYTKAVNKKLGPGLGSELMFLSYIAS